MKNRAKITKVLDVLTVICTILGAGLIIYGVISQFVDGIESVSIFSLLVVVFLTANLLVSHFTRRRRSQDGGNDGG